MTAHHIGRMVGATVLAASAVSGSALGGNAPVAAAQPCPDVEVVFARGTGESPGAGPTGQAFVDSLRERINGKSVGVYPVNYPATDQWATGVDGVRDAAAHVLSTARGCPDTKMVLGGYSQGAAVIAFVTSPAVPAGIDPATVPQPLQPEVADHVVAVTLFGLPNARAMNFLGQPPVDIGPLYEAKAIELCVTDDPVCSDGLNFSAHSDYARRDTLIDRGANFAASQIDPSLGGAGAESPRGGFGS